MATHHLNLDINKRATALPDEVVVRVGDVGSQTVVAELTDDGTPYAVPTGSTVRLDVIRADGCLVRQTGSSAGSSVTVTLPDAAVAVAGLARIAYISILQGEDVVESTDAFSLRVEEGTGTRALAAAKDYDDALEALYSRWKELEEQAAEAEGARAAAEEARASAEVARVSAESGRVQAEAGRVSSEEGRAAAEAERAASELRRVAAELDRAQTEAARAAAELERVTAEAQRVTGWATITAQWSEIISSIGSSTFAKLEEGEYDPATGRPTLEAGAPNVIYLAPETGPDASNGFCEWVYVDDSWEELGPAAPTPVPIPVDAIAALVDEGTQMLGTRYLDANGLNYLFGRQAEIYAATVHTHAAGDIVSGTLPVDRGGTGAATAEAARTSLGAASSDEVATLRDSVSRCSLWSPIRSQTTPRWWFTTESAAPYPNDVVLTICGDDTGSSANAVGRVLACAPGVALQRRLELSSGRCIFTMRSGIVSVQLKAGASAWSIPESYGSVALGTLPDGWRPTVPTFIPVTSQANPGCVAYLSVATTGAVVLQNHGGSAITTDVYAQGCYIAEVMS